MFRFLIDAHPKTCAAITVTSAEITDPLCFLKNRRHEIFELISALYADNPFVVSIGKPVIARRRIVVPAASGFEFRQLLVSRVGPRRAHARQRRLLCERRKGQELHREREREDEMKRAMSGLEIARRTYDESTRHSLSCRFIRRHGL